MRLMLAALLLPLFAASAAADSPSAVLPQPTLTPTLPIAGPRAPGPDAPQETTKAPGCDLQRVMEVETASASPMPDGYVVDAYGSSESLGWALPKLVLDNVSPDGVEATVDFVACRPEVSAQVITAIEAHTAFGLAPTVKRIIVRSRTKTVAVDVGK